MKPRIRVGRAYGWWLTYCPMHGLELYPTWPTALAAANAHARTHARTDIASFLALRDDHPASERRWETPLPHDLEPPC